VLTDRVDAMVDAMKALGLKDDSKLNAAIKRALLDSNHLETVKYSGFNVEVMNVNCLSISIIIAKPPVCCVSGGFLFVCKLLTVVCSLIHLIHHVTTTILILEQLLLLCLLLILEYRT